MIKDDHREGALAFLKQVEAKAVPVLGDDGVMNRIRQRCSTAKLVRWQNRQWNLTAAGYAFLHGNSTPKEVAARLIPDELPFGLRGEQLVEIDYTNYKQERAKRIICPKRIYFGFDAIYHPQNQWLMLAWDIVKADWRIFAMRDIHEWSVR